MVHLCVDVGKTTTRVEILYDRTEEAGRYPTEELLTDSNGGYLAGLSDLLKELLDKNGITVSEVDAIGLSAPGEVYQERDEAYFPGDGVTAPTPVREFGDLYVSNDATLGAIGEFVYGGHETDDLIYLTISTGIGAGYVLDGQLIEGWNGNAGEVGHLRLTDCSIPCKWCDGVGHWMTCSGAQLPELAIEVADLEVESAEELFARYDAGNPAAETTVEKMNQYNAEAITQMINILNPEVVALGGSVALNNPETIIGGIESRLGEGCMNEIPRIVVSNTGERAILAGLEAVCRGDFAYPQFFT